MTEKVQTAPQEETCRICLESSPVANSSNCSVSKFTAVDADDRLISPCACSGTFRSPGTKADSSCHTCNLHHSVRCFIYWSLGFSFIRLSSPCFDIFYLRPLYWYNPQLASCLLFCAIFVGHIVNHISSFLLSRFSPHWHIYWNCRNSSIRALQMPSEVAGISYGFKKTRPRPDPSSYVSGTFELNL